MKTSAIKKIVILVLNTGVTKVLGLLTHFFVASYLSKEEFGIYAIVIVILSFSDALRNGGAHQYLMHHNDRINAIKAEVYYLGLLFNGGLMVVLVMSSKSIANFYQAEILEDLLYLLAASIPLSTPWVVYRVELLVNNKYDLVSKIRLAADFIKYTLIIGLVYYGFGLISMIFPLLIENIFLTIMGWRVSGKWLRLDKFNAKKLCSILKDTKWIMLGTIAIALSKQGDYFAFSFYITKENLGLYYFSYQLVFSIVVFFITLSEFIFLPLFAKKKTEKAQLSNFIVTILSGTTLIGVCISIILYFFIGDIIQYVWGGKWDDSIELVEILLPLIVFLNIYYISRAMCDALGLWRLRILLNSVYGIGIVFVTALSAMNIGDIKMITLNIIYFHIAFSILQLVIILRVAKINVVTVFYSFILLALPMILSIFSLGLFEIYLDSKICKVIFLLVTYLLFYLIMTMPFSKNRSLSKKRLLLLYKSIG